MPRQKQKEPASNVGVFAELLTLYLERKNVSQTQLANDIHVQPSTISQWLSSDRLLNDSNLIHQIADVLNLTPDEKNALLSGFSIDQLIKANQDYIYGASSPQDLSPLENIIEQCETPIRKVNPKYKTSLWRRIW